MNDKIQKPDMALTPEIRDAEIEVVISEDTRDLVEFKSTPEFFEKERSGKKPNTERKFRKDDKDPRLGKLKTGAAKRIRITNTVTKEVFTREISDISLWEGVWIISWIHCGGL